ncbi:hypothetical protein Tco_0285094 [Tanacetum coccineum]
MYAKVFGIDVPLTQSQPTESTHETHRTTSAPKSPNHDKEAAESSAPRRSKLRYHKEIEKMVDGQENIVDDSSIPMNDEPSIPDTKIEPRSNKESSEVEITKDKEVEITKEKEVEIIKETLVVDITNVAQSQLSLCSKTTISTVPSKESDPQSNNKLAIWLALRDENDIEDIIHVDYNARYPVLCRNRMQWSNIGIHRSTVTWKSCMTPLRIESYQPKVNLTAPTMTFPRIEDHEMFSIIYEPVHGIIYKNSKKEKRVMRHSEIHKFCDAYVNKC